MMSRVDVGGRKCNQFHKKVANQIQAVDSAKLVRKEMKDSLVQQGLILGLLYSMERDVCLSFHGFRLQEALVAAVGDDLVVVATV